MASQRPRSADLYPGPGFRIRSDFSRLDAALMKRFQEYEVPEISDRLRQQASSTEKAIRDRAAERPSESGTHR